MSLASRFMQSLEAHFITARLLFGSLKQSDPRFEKLRGELERLDKLATGVNERRLLHAVGVALTAWARMEEAMVVIAMHLLQVRPEKAGVVMYSIINFNTWPSLIDELFALDKDLKHYQPRFNKITKRIRKIKDQRDQLAHNSYRRPKAMLVSSRFDARIKSKKQQPLSTEEITIFTSKVIAIAEDLFDLGDAMDNEREALRKKSRKPTSDH